MFSTQTSHREAGPFFPILPSHYYVSRKGCQVPCIIFCLHFSLRAFSIACDEDCNKSTAWYEQIHFSAANSNEKRAGN